MNYSIVQNFPNYIIYKDGRVFNISRKTFLTPSKLQDTGYLYYTLYDGKGGKKVQKIHRLIGEHFIKRVEGKHCIDHIDRNKLNNDISNLRWVTVSENNRNTSRTRHDIDEWSNMRLRNNIINSLNQKLPYHCDLCDRDMTRGASSTHIKNSKIHQKNLEIYEKNKKNYNSVVNTLNDSFALNKFFIKKLD
jgi:hypothetical protein